MRVIDKDGVWLRNTGEFRIPDYGREGDVIFLEPGENTKVHKSKYIADQPSVIDVEDPFEGEAEAKPAPKSKK